MPRFTAPSPRKRKKHLQKLCKCLIFSVDQLGLEPRTSRLWVSQSDILWDFVVWKWRWLSVLYKITIFFESQIIPLTEIVCLRIVYAEIGHNSTRPLVCRSIRFLRITSRNLHGNTRNFHTFTWDVRKYKALNNSYIHIFSDNTALADARKIARNRS